MDPARKRKIRLVMALSAAVMLAVALVYTSFGAANSAVQPSELLAGDHQGNYQLNGIVVGGSVKEGTPLRFELVDRDQTGPRVPVAYTGAVPDPFRSGREVLLTGHLNENGIFVGDKDSLITKCPSKFKEQYGNDSNIDYTQD